MNGHYNYLGEYPISQNPNVEKIFDDFLKNEKFSIIVEIGTQFGGLTFLIRDILNKYSKDTPIISYDVYQRGDLKRQCIERNIDFRLVDCFNDNELPFIIENNERVLLICDGGNKIEEFNQFSSYLKTGDIVMCHDYSPTVEYFEENMKGKVWDWLEISDSYIQKSIDKYNLKKHETYYDLFLNLSSWGVFIKHYDDNTKL